jgi:chromosome condensin MukBEF MukE localization factor
MHVLASHSCSDDANSTDSFESQSYQLAEHVFRFRALSRAMDRLQSWSAKKRVLRDVFDGWHHHTELQLRLAKAKATLQKANCQRAKVCVLAESNVHALT